MTLDELETLLRAWGRVYGERPVIDDEDRDAPAVHAIARGMEFAPGKRQVVIRQRTAMHRAGQDRRTLMAVAAGGAAVGLRVVSAAFVDPVPCIETRSGRSESRDWPVPPAIARVEREALNLQAFDDLRGRCLRAYYCMRGSPEEKVMKMMANMDQAELDKLPGGYLRIKRFRDEVGNARIWIHARLA